MSHGKTSACRAAALELGAEFWKREADYYRAAHDTLLVDYQQLLKKPAKGEAGEIIQCPGCGPRPASFFYEYRENNAERTLTRRKFCKFCLREREKERLASGGRKKRGGKLKKPLGQAPPLTVAPPSPSVQLGTVPEGN